MRALEHGGACAVGDFELEVAKRSGMLCVEQREKWRPGDCFGGEGLLPERGRTPSSRAESSHIWLLPMDCHLTFPNVTRGIYASFEYFKAFF
jgi:hypothetical protein